MLLRRAVAAPLFEPLEQRLLYSADFSPLALAAGGDDVAEHRLLQQPIAATQSASVEIAFVDMSLPDAERLVADLQAQRDAGRPIEVVRIGAGDDGVAAIGAALDGRSDIGAVHLLSHGADGVLQLGSARLDATTLLARAGEIARWGAALNGDADLLIYGCDVAAGADGRQFVADLAALTGADVAASTDLTGAAARGGDWTLEHQLGRIDTNPVLSAAVREAWQGTLATFTVTTTDDTVLLGSLRWAITQANLSLGADTIVLGAGTYTLSVAELLPDDNLGGDLDINGSVSIVGAGAGSTIVNGNGSGRVFDVHGGDVGLSGMTITGGAAASGGAARVANGASLSLDQSVVQNNSATDGGAIYNQGTLTITDTELRNNTASGDGGALWQGGGASATLQRVTIAGNQAVNGGGIEQLDGAILNLANVTLSGNTATGTGGALCAGGDVTLLNVTIADNTAALGGGIHVGVGASVSLQNTLLSGNAGGNVAGDAVTSLGHNLSTSAVVGMTQPTDIVTVSAGIGALADNGGYTRTHALLVGSAALNSGDTAAAPATDQRGVARNGAADIGAFEGNSPPSIAAIANQSTAEDTPLGPIAITIGDAETPVGSLVVSATSSDTSIVAPAGLVLGGSGANRTLTITPVANANGGPVTITVNVFDGLQTTSTTFDLTVSAVNDAPSVAPIALGTIAEDGSRLITQADLLAGASDVEGSTLTAVNLALSAGSGSLTDHGNGTWTFAPAANWNGAAAFNFGVSDGSATTANSASLTVSAVNDAPSVAPVALGTIAEDGSRLITQADLLAGASDVDGDTLSAVNLSLTAGNGVLSDNGDATWTFTPAADWNGAASFSFGVTDGIAVVANSASLGVSAVNDAPAVSAVDLGTIAEDGSRLITQADLLAGASDVDGDPLNAISLLLTGGSGTLTDQGNGTWTFAPSADWNGSASFSFGVSDGTATTPNSASLTVSAVNDAPVAGGAIDLGAINEFSTRFVTQADLLAGASDIDGDALSAVNLTLTAGSGTLTDHGNGTWTFDPAAGWIGTATFGFDVGDGSATVPNSASLLVSAGAPSVTPIALGAIAEDGSRLVTQADLLAGASDPDGDPLNAINLALTSGSGSLTDHGDGTWTFAPAADWNGAVMFGFGVADGSVVVANTASLTVSAVNDAPVVGAVGLGAIAEDGSRLITQADLLAGASDVEGDALSAVNLALTAGSGTLTDHGNGSWTYTPAANWNGAAAFSFGVSDGNATTPNTASLTVSAVNDVPVVSAIDLGAIAEDGSRLITQADLLAGASDVEGDALSAVNLALTAGSGTLTDHGDGTWTFTPAANWNGAVAFSVGVGDGTATVANTASLTVNAVNDAPVLAGPTSFAVDEPAKVVATISATDVDAGSALTFAIAGGADAARFRIDATSGELAFVAPPDFEQPTDADADNRYEVIVAVSDGSLAAQQLLQVDVRNVDEAPVITANTLLVSGGSTSLILHAADADTPASALRFDAGGMVGGQFELAGQPVSTFTLADVQAGNVRFVLDGSGATPGYTLALSDAVSTVTSAAVVVVEATAPVAGTTPVSPPPAPAAAPPALTPPAAPPIASGPVAPALPSSGGGAATPPLLDAPASPEFEPSASGGSRVAIVVPLSGRTDLAAAQTDVAFELPSAEYAASGDAAAGALPSDAANALRDLDLARQFDRVRDELVATLNAGPDVATTLLLSGGLSIGYALWLSRGGVLLATLLSTLPAWSNLDPLPVLAQVRRGDEDDDEIAGRDADPIEQLFAKARRLLAREPA